MSTPSTDEDSASASNASAGTGLTRGVVFALAAVWLIWSSTYYVLRVAVLVLPQFWTVGVRFVIAGALLSGFARLRGDTFPKGRAWLHIIAIGVLLFVVGNGFVAFASREISSGVVAIVCGTMPLWTALLGRFLGAPVTARELFGLVIGFAAVALLMWGDELRGDVMSVVLLCLAPIGWALGSLLVRQVKQSSPAATAGVQMLVGGVGLLAVSAAIGEPMVPESVPLETWLAMAYLIGAGSLVGFVSYQYLLREARPALATSYAYVNPVLAVVLGTTVGGERISAHGVVALVLIALAVISIVARPKIAPSALEIPRVIPPEPKPAQ